MNPWTKYKSIIKSNFESSNIHSDNLEYWRNLLFANTIIYILPLSLLTYIPGMAFSIANNLTEFILIDTLSLLIIMCIGFLPGLSLQVRKTLFIFVIFSVAIALLYLIGLTGPGLLYMLAANFFCVIIVSNQYSYYPSFINLAICIVIIFLIPQNILPWADEPAHNIPQFIAVTSNLIFLSFLTSALLPKIFNGLQKSIEREQKIRVEIDNQKNILEKTLRDLENKNKDLKMFAFTASHDLQEPLRMITSFLGQLEKKYGDMLDEKAHKYIFFAVDGAKRMRRIILDLLDFSRIGNHEGEEEMIDLNEIVEEISLLEKKTIEEKKAIIEAQKLPKILNYRIPVMQIFRNLINNALKYSKNGVAPIILITSEDKQGKWLFAVKDNGIGIEAEHFKRIFIIFQRLHPKDKYDGTGMGLAIVKKIVESMEGKIWVESEEGKGATFYFTLPK